MLTALLPACARVVCTTAPSPRALDAGSLAALCVRDRRRNAPRRRHYRHRRPGGGDGRRLSRWRARRRRRIDLSHRSPAWYPSLIKALILLAVVLALVCMPGMGGVAPANAQTPQGEIAGCRISLMFGATQDALTKEIDGRTERVLVLTGSGAIPVQVDCDDTQFFADFAEIYPDSNRIVATGNVKVGTPTSFITAERVEFDTKARTGTFYQAHGMASLGDRVEQEHVRHAGGRCDVSRPRDPQARAEEIQGRRRCLHDVRATDAALASRVGRRHYQPRRLRAPQELGLSGQGRAADVPPDLLLPDSGGRPGHRLSDPHLRHVDLPGQFLEQRLLLGDLTQSGRDDRP